MRVKVGDLMVGYPLNVNQSGSGLQTIATFSNQQGAAAGVGPQMRFSGTGDVGIAIMAAAWDGSATTDGYLGFWTRGSDSVQERWRILSNGDLSAQGAHTIEFGVHSAIGAETVTGFITIKDSGGTTRKLAVVS